MFAVLLNLLFSKWLKLEKGFQAPHPTQRLTIPTLDPCQRLMKKAAYKNN